MRFLADENFNNDILRGVRRAYPELDCIRVQDTQYAEAEDPLVLEWAAEENRVLLTHDEQTMTGFAYDRVREGLPMPGVIEVPTELPIGRAIEDILIIIGISQENGLENQVLFLPL